MLAAAVDMPKSVILISFLMRRKLGLLISRWRSLLLCRNATAVVASIAHLILVLHDIVFNKKEE